MASDRRRTVGTFAATLIVLAFGGRPVAICADENLRADTPPAAATAPQDAPSTRTERPNIVLVLVDDLRHDAASFLGHPYLETPNLDRLARGGAVCENTFVTTSLCSPSRASILTGQYAHNHGVIDNYTPVAPDLRFFPEDLQQNGYETAFIGKWHMGDTDEPQRGFDHWVAFKGQGIYYPGNRGTTRVVPQTSDEGYNVNSRRAPQTRYITDELTDLALDWLKDRDPDRPFFLYLSHKAVHSDFVPADRHRGHYAGQTVPLPATYANTPENYDDKPMWLKNQRNSRHGVDFAYNLEDFDLQAYQQRYYETLLAVDENLGRLIDALDDAGQLDNTLFLYMGDNGFQFGEHGLIDKRTAYEASIRVLLVVHWPARIPPKTRVKSMVANIDIAPTLLDAVGETPRDGVEYDGVSVLDAWLGHAGPDRDALLYEYFWEWNYPQTPTMHAIRTDRYKFIRYQGLWDRDELYDLRTDPDESTNLIDDSDHRELIGKLKDRLFRMLVESDGQQMPLRQERGERYPWRRPDGASQAPFPEEFFRNPRGR